MALTKERDDLAVITCFFTPEPHQLRVRNFEAFRKQFERTLYIAELAFGQRPWLTPPGPHTMHFRGEGRHIMWQKERLLNAIVRQLPRHVAHVAWVDSDIVFQDPEWPTQAVEQLKNRAVIQLFDTVVCLDQNGFPDLQLAGSIAHGGMSEDGEAGGTPGFAWAARRDVLETVPLLEVMILGGADTCMAAGFSGDRSPAILDRLPRRLRRAVETWLKKAGETTAGNVGYLPGTVEHLFHGPFASREYLERYELLRKADFDPAVDLVPESTGLFAWKNFNGQLPAGVHNYFARRAETENARSG